MHQPQFWFRTVLLIFGIWIMCLPTGGARADEPVRLAALQVPEAQVDAPRLFASEETRRSLGSMAAYIPQWAGMDTLIVTADDLRSRSGNDNHTLADTFSAFAAQVPDFPAHRIAEQYDLLTFVRFVADSTPRGFPLPAQAAGERDVCAITIPALEQGRGDGLVRRISALSDSAADFIPGDARDWRMLIIAHETRHCRHDPGERGEMASLQREREADQHAIDMYLRDAESVLGPREDVLAVPAALVAFRGMMAMDGKKLHHAHSAGLELPGVLPSVAEDRETLAQGLRDARQAVWNMARTGKPKPFLPIAVWTRPEPREIYAAARFLYDAKYFDDAPVQKRYVEDFLAGAERYFPTHFGMDGKSAL